MIGYIFNDIVHAFPETINARQTPELMLFSEDTLNCSDSNVVIEFITTNIYKVNVSACDDKAEVTFSNFNDSVTTIVYNEVVDIEHLTNWLKMQQLGYMIPIMNKIGWSKLKEAALKARKLSDMQGTECALKMMLSILEADNNVKLWRYWHRETDTYTPHPYDNMDATDLADVGFDLTGELKLTYQQDRLNPWSEQITDNLQSMIFTLDEVVTCIKGVLPATLAITDYEFIRLGLGVIQMMLSSYTSSMQSSDVNIGTDIIMPDAIQYSYEPFVYSLQTKELVRVANHDDPNAIGSYKAVMKVEPLDSVYDLHVFIDDEEVLSIDYIDKTTYYCLTPSVGEHTMKWYYRAESGNSFEKSKQLTVVPATTRQEILEFADGISGEIPSYELVFANMTALIMQWMSDSLYCRANQAIPRSYQIYFIPIEDYQAQDVTPSKLRIIHGTETFLIDDFSTKMSEPRYMPDIPGFTVSFERIVMLGIGVGKYMILSTIDYAGKYDYSIQYYFNNAWQTPVQLSKYLSVHARPCWTMHTLHHMADNFGHSTAVISIDNEQFANNGEFMPIEPDIPYAKKVQKVPCLMTRLNQSHDELLMIEAYRPGATLRYQYGNDVMEVKAVDRQPSFSINIAKHFIADRPYIAYRQDCYIDLYYDDVLVKEGWTLMVFHIPANAKSARIHIYNDWYDKTIELDHKQ